MTSILTRPGPAPDRTEHYGPDPDQVYDVRPPSDEGIGCTVAIVHGGFWRPATDRSHASNQSAAFAASGFHVATIEYRRPEHGRWPVLATDVRHAVETVVADPSLPDDVVLLGHSAGGQLVTWLLGQDVAARVRGVVSLAGVLSLHDAYFEELGAGAAAAMMDSTPEAAGRDWALADPTVLRLHERPTVLVHGTDDDVVPIAQSEAFCEEHPWAQLVRLEGVGHYELIDPGTEAFGAAVTAVRGIAEA